MLNNPISYVDPDGRNPIIIGMMIGGTAGFGIGYASGLRGNELLASTLGGMALGAGIGGGFFNGFGQGVGGVLANAPGAGGNLAQTVFQGVTPTLTADIGLQLVSNSGWGPATASLSPGPPGSVWQQLGQQFAPTPQNWIPGYSLVQNYGWNPQNWPTYDGPVVTGAPPILPSTFPVGCLIRGS